MNHCLNIFNFRNSSLQIGECMGVAHMSLFISIAPKLVQRSGNQPAIHLPHINPINNLYFPIGILKNDEWHETKSQVIFVSFSTAITSCRCAHSAHYQPAVILVQKRNFFLINFLVYFFFLENPIRFPATLAHPSHFPCKRNAIAAHLLPLSGCFCWMF